MYINPSSLDTEQLSYKPTTPLEWAKQALLQANAAKTKAIDKMKRKCPWSFLAVSARMASYTVFSKHNGKMMFVKMKLKDVPEGAVIHIDSHRDQEQLDGKCKSRNANPIYKGHPRSAKLKGLGRRLR